MSDHRQSMAAENSFSIKPKVMNEQTAKQRAQWSKVTGSYPSDQPLNMDELDGNVQRRQPTEQPHHDRLPQQRTRPDFGESDRTKEPDHLSLPANARDEERPVEPQATEIAWPTAQEQPKEAPPKQAPARKSRRDRRAAPNAAQMRSTLAALNEERATLQEKLKVLGEDEDTKFELDLVSKNIRTMEEKIAKLE